MAALIQGASSLNSDSIQRDLRQTQERLQLIIDHIDTITNVNNFKQMTSQHHADIIFKLKELYATLENLQPSHSVLGIAGYEDLNDTRRKLQIVIGVLLNSLSRFTPTDASAALPGTKEIEQITFPAKPAGSSFDIPVIAPPKKLASFSELVTALDESSCFGAHQLLQEPTPWKRHILGDFCSLIVPKAEQRKTKVVDNGNGGKVPVLDVASRTTSSFASETNRSGTSLASSKMVATTPGQQQLTFQLQVRMPPGQGKDNSTATTVSTLVDGTLGHQQKSWQHLAAPASKIEEVFQQLLAQGFNSETASEAISSAIETCEKRQNHSSPTENITANAGFPLSKTQGSNGGVPSAGLRAKPEERYTAGGTCLWSTGEGKGCGNCIYCNLQRGAAAGTGTTGLTTATATTTTTATDPASQSHRNAGFVENAAAILSGQNWFGETDRSEKSLFSTPDPWPGDGSEPYTKDQAQGGSSLSLGGGSFRLEVLMHGLTFFLCIIPFAMMWYWMSAFFTSHTTALA